MKMKFAIRCFSVAIAAVGFLLVPNLLAQPTVAGTCASNCGPQPLQFKPGQQVAVEIANRTFNLIHVQKVYGTDTVSLSPGQSLRVRQGDGTEPNVSVMFWDANGLPLKAVLSKSGDNLLRIQLRPSYDPPGDSSVYIQNDGRVRVL